MTYYKLQGGDVFWVGREKSENHQIHNLELCQILYKLFYVHEHVKFIVRGNLRVHLIQHLCQSGLDFARGDHPY